MAKRNKRFQNLEYEEYEEYEEKEELTSLTEISDYEKDLFIDMYDLHNEWNNQPQLFMKYAKEAATADEELKRIKEKLELKKSELYMQIRTEKEDNKEKVTEAILEAEIKLDETYQDIYDLYIEASKNVKIINAAVESFNQRRAALENIVKLQLAGYYSAPNDKDMKEEIQTATKQKIRNNLKTKSKKDSK